MAEPVYFVGFGKLEELVEDLQTDGVDLVRVDMQIIAGKPGQHGIYYERMGVIVASHVESEVRYCWVITGGRQMLATTVLSGEEAPKRTEKAYATIVDWLKGQGFRVRMGSYSMSSDLRLMLGTAECIRA